MCRERNSCPRCTGQGLVPIPGGAQCLLCGHEEVEDDLAGFYRELMAAVPGMPLPSRAERYDERVRRGARGLALAEEAAERRGVPLGDLRKRMHWKTTPLRTRVAFQLAIYDLTVAGFNVLEVAAALGKSPRTIGKGTGLARGRAARKGVCP